ncbi:C-C chemokine receptor type 1-like isoform X2 [Pungitius pungitius]|uniref:C-C chemokine receptor type 1-like isoform X2 n=1 Tax=Pungitius pungitius TaxID=134920 RepID=UPI002E14C6B6
MEGDEEDYTMDTNYSTYYDQNEDMHYMPCSNIGLRDFGEVFLPTFYSLVFILGVIGNGLVVCVVVMYQNKLQDMWLINLAVSDLVFVFTLPFYAHYSLVGEWPFGDIFCRFASGSHTTGFLSSIFFMVVMTLDRYIKVFLDVNTVARYRTFRAGIALTVFVWTLSLCFSLPAIIFTKVKNDSSEVTCSYEPENKAWRLYDIILKNVFGLGIPLLAIIVCFSRIIPKLLKMRSGKKHRVVKLIISIVIAFFVFWAPYNISILLQFLNMLTDCNSLQRLKLSIIVTETIAYSHCCLNPIIYAFVGQKFRRQVFQLLRK